MEFLYTIKSKRIIVESLVTTQTNIYFFGDVHRDTKSCDESRWQWFLKEAKHDKNAYFFGLGDYNDFASISEGKKLISAALHETTMEKFDQIAEVDNSRFAEETSFMQGHCLGLISGNHGWKFANGKTGDEDLAERLKTESLGYLCHYTLTFSERSETMDTGKNASVHFVLCHGKAGGKTAGITITQVDDLRRIFPIADIYVMGHDHQRGALPQSVLIPSLKKDGTYTIKQKRQFLCRSGAFKRAYVEDNSSYEVGRLLKPSDLGALKLTITFHRDKSNDRDVVITDIQAVI